MEVEGSAVRQTGDVPASSSSFCFVVLTHDRGRILHFNVTAHPTAAWAAQQSPWQNPHAERVIGSIRRECLDHLIVLNENDLRRILCEYTTYYDESRPHLSLAGNAPDPREVEPPSREPVVAVPVLGGLHHRYRRAA
jgi:putative transposase